MNEIELAQKLVALNEYTNNRRHELHDSGAKPDLGELWKALQAVGLNPASGVRLGSCNLITVQILGRSAGTGGSGQT